MTSLTTWWRQVLVAGLAVFGAAALVIGFVSVNAAAAPGGQAPTCSPGLNPHGPDGCETPAGSGGKGCDHGKGLNKKKGGQGADCGSTVSDPPPVLGGGDGSGGDGSGGDGSGGDGSGGDGSGGDGSGGGTSGGDETSGGNESGGSPPGASEIDIFDPDEGTTGGDDSNGPPTAVLGEQVTAERPRGGPAAPEHLALTGPSGSELLVLLGALMTTTGVIFHLAGRGSRLAGRGNRRQVG